MTNSIVLLAAGMSTRYGRLKQLESVGPGGEALLDYAVYDAHKAGFRRVVMIIREELEPAFREHISHRWPEDMKVVFHHQRLDALPAEGLSRKDLAAICAARKKPWGTAHALWSARDLLQGPFAILNADDFYGASAFAQAAALLRRNLRGDPGEPPNFGLVAYTLGDTLSLHGGVSRGICRVDSKGWLESVEEAVQVRRSGEAITGETVHGKALTLSGQEPISTNFWVLTPELFPLLESGLRDFIEGRIADERAGGEGKVEIEYLIPTEINRLLTKREARVWVLRIGDPFFGITHPLDWEWVAGSLRELIREGKYPETLW